MAHHKNIDEVLKKLAVEKEFTVDDFLPQEVVYLIKAYGYPNVTKMKNSYIFHDKNYLKELRFTYDPKHEILIGSHSVENLLINYRLAKSIGKKAGYEITELPGHKLILKRKGEEIRISPNNIKGVIVYSYAGKRSSVIKFALGAAKNQSKGQTSRPTKGYNS